MHHLRLSAGAFQVISRSSSRYAWRLYSTTSENKENFEIPNYIKRSPTEILRALSQTVGYDPTAPHFKYHDDPYLAPMSNVGKRTFALAMESGRKSAKWVRQEHSKLFQVSIENFL
jgi:pentatricopeptide repeat domain-containing protein 3